MGSTGRLSSGPGGARGQPSTVRHQPESTVMPATSLVGTTRNRLFVAAALMGLGLIAAWRAPIWPSRSTRVPNILLITLDTTRADHLGAYGNVAAQTPTFDRLPSEGVLFERAVSVAPITLPAHVSLLTGRYPFAHGVRNNGNS